MAVAVAAAWRALGGAPGAVEALRWSGPDGMLAARLPVASLAQATVAACVLAAAEWSAVCGRPVAEAPVDAGNVATAFVSERHLRVGGAAFESFAGLSRFWPASDGWVRTHGNYPHHAERLRRALGVDRDEAVGPAIAARPAVEVEDVVLAADGLAFAVRSPSEWLAHPQGAAVAGLPLLTLRAAASGDPVAPAARFRVLDLTRVIAGPVGTRTLALLGADVLRVDPPALPELPAQHLDTGFGKRSTLLDLARAADRRTFEDLLDGADAVVTGYRPGALDRFGLAPEALLERRPGLVVARLCAWGPVGPWAVQRGFDSLVQAATGIAAVEGTPGVLPAQALDHGTGYLLAAAVLRALAQRARVGGGWVAELSLAQTAHWLLHGIPRTDPGGVEVPPDPWCAEMDGIRYALPPVRLPGAPATWAHPPHAWGADRPVWT